MNVTVEISCPSYDLLVKNSSVLSRHYRVLKRGFSVRGRNKNGEIDRIVVIRCTEDEARALLELATSVSPDAVSEIKKSMNALGVVRFSSLIC